MLLKRREPAFHHWNAVTDAPWLVSTHHVCRPLLDRRNFSAQPIATPVDLSFDLYTPSNGNRTDGALVILHGLFGSKRNFASLCKAFQRDLDRPIYALDLRNHGSSPHATPMDYHSMASDVQHFITRNGLENFSVLGHSMGGKVAMALALSSRSQLPNLQNLIISDIAPTQGSLPSSFARYLEVMSVIENPASKVRTRDAADSILKTVERDLSIRQFLLTNLTLPTDPSNTAKFKIPVDILRGAIKDIGSFPFLPLGYETWNGRMLVVKGAKSAYITPSSTSSFKAFFPKMEMEMLDTGHWVHAEKPNEFKKIVVDFIMKA